MKKKTLLNFNSLDSITEKTGSTSDLIDSTSPLSASNSMVSVVAAAVDASIDSNNNNSNINDDDDDLDDENDAADNEFLKQLESTELSALAAANMPSAEVTTTSLLLLICQMHL